MPTQFILLGATLNGQQIFTICMDKIFHFFVLHVCMSLIVLSLATGIIGQRNRRGDKIDQY